MASKKTAILGSSGRQAAYTARSRAALIESAQQVLAEIGPDATIEQFVARAKVSPNTVYNYFEGKEQLFGEALQQIFFEWLAWAYNGKEQGESLEASLTVCRKLFWLEKTHPLLANILKNSSERPLFLLDHLADNAAIAFKEVMQKGQLPEKDFNSRFLLWGSCVVALIREVMDGSLSPSDAEEALAISLSIWAITPAKAAKLLSAPLEIDL
jgi:AcrR family transcriptional regulator